MDRMIYTAMSGASQTMERQASVAQNLANVNSTGYRAEEQRLRAVQVIPGAGSTALPTRAFVIDASTHTDFTPGPLQMTARPLDVAVQGQGWIALAMPDGSEAYTRDGSLHEDVNGVLQTRTGIPVQGDGGTISIPPDVKVTIGADGTVSVVPLGQTPDTLAAVGRIKLVNPPVSSLARQPDGLFALANGRTAPADASVRLASGVLESSNVDVADAMVNMIDLARSFDLQVKVMKNDKSNSAAASQLLQPG